MTLGYTLFVSRGTSYSVGGNRKVRVMVRIRVRVRVMERVVVTVTVS